MKVLAISPEQFDSDVHHLPIAGELLLPGVQAVIQDDGIAFEMKQTIIADESYGTVIELCKKGELVEIGVTGDREDDGGFFIERVWVLAE